MPIIVPVRSLRRRGSQKSRIQLQRYVHFTTVSKRDDQTVVLKSQSAGAIAGDCLGFAGAIGHADSSMIGDSF